LWRIDNCLTIPRIAQPAPPGTYVNMWFGRQADAAEQDDFVIYRNMWYKGGTELGPMGRYYIDMITSRLAKVPFPVVIETSHDDRIDDARRAVVLSLLEKRGFTDPTRVIVAYSIAEGLYAEEAQRIASTYLNGGYGGNGTNFGYGGFGGLGGFGGGFGGFGGGLFGR
jgi:hypothetical protein